MQPDPLAAALEWLEQQIAHDRQAVLGWHDLGSDCEWTAPRHAAGPYRSRDGFPEVLADAA